MTKECIDSYNLRHELEREHCVELWRESLRHQIFKMSRHPAVSRTRHNYKQNVNLVRDFKLEEEGALSRRHAPCAGCLQFRREEEEYY